MKKAAIFLGLMGIALATCAPAQAADSRSTLSHPEQSIDLVPFLSMIPRSFLVGDGYAMKFSGTSLRIDHMGFKSRSASQHRNCIIGFSYTTPVLGFFTTRVDIPIFHADSPSSAWGMNAMGDYVAHFSKGTDVSAGIRLMSSLRF